jgi:cytochrome c oxidase cbb3-type subunit III
VNITMCSSIRSRLWVLALMMAVPLYVHAQIQARPVDQASADRGEKVFAQTCAQCHGADARGTESGPDLIRSLVVLHDRMQELHGSEIAPLLKKTPSHNFDISQTAIADISQFLTLTINRTLRSGYSNQPTDMLSGDPKAGEAFFKGAGGCDKCHSVTGDLAGIATRYEPAVLQQRFVFPNSGRVARGPGIFTTPAKPQVTITMPGGKPIKGALVKIDDFKVTLVDAAGETRTLVRAEGTKVVVDDPFAAHIALLDKYTDADIHNMTAYLETLK